MTQSSFAARALALFDAALDQPATDRARWIDEHAEGDTALASEARQLLRAAGTRAGILELSPNAPFRPDLAESIAAALDDRYDVLREIGRGGMATVFLARERKHDREVVLKVLNPMLAQMCGAERFEREVFIAATLSHPHIVPLIDSGEAGGYLYYVMPWMDGRSLRAVMQDERVSLVDALRILHDVATALEFAHAAGVVHRDLKPENVLMASGHAYLLDFGIAKLASDATESASITAPGFALGTRRYMAPEQVFAASTVDARADIWAWGVLGAELLTGGPLADGEPSVIARHALERETALPRAIVSLLIDCLATDPTQRPPDMSSVLARLTAQPAPRRVRHRHARTQLLVSTAIGVVILAGAARVLRGTPQGSGAVLAEPVAVSVLRNETGDTSLTVLGRFAGDLITDGLQRLAVAKVVPWSGALLASEHAAAHGASLVSALHEETQAGTVVTGSYYRLRDSLHLQAQLVDAQSGELVSLLAPIIVPAATPEVGVAQLRDRVLGAVAAARDERIAAMPGLTRTPPSFSAYEAFDRGLDNFLTQKYPAALDRFRTAFERDTTFTAAAVWGARAALNVDSISTAMQLAQRARAAGADLGAFNDASLRYIEARLMGDGAAARSAAQQASALAPNSRAGYDYAVALLSGGFTRAAREQLLRMDPDRGEMRDWSSYWTQRANVAYLLGNHVEELSAARELHRRFPERRVAAILEARALAALGDHRALDSALAAGQSLPTNVYWSHGAAMVVASEELMRRGNESDGRRYAERAVTWFAARLAADPTDQAHRYWMGSALYDLARYQAARPYFESLAREYPARLEYRGLAALVAARRRDLDGASRWLGPAAPHEIPLHMVFCARIAAISGKTENAITFLTSAADHGIEHYPWLAGSAFRDFTAVERDPRGKALLSGR
ncbi:MAG: protein kinase [Gemmatimonadaceae bacterium]|nr:protein kinase [Gemmatimonadaceae bacterium]